MSLPDYSTATLDRLLARLNARATHLAAELTHLPGLPESGQSVDEQAQALQHALTHYWNAPDASGLPRRQALATALRDDLHDEVLLRSIDGSLHPDYLDCLPPDSTGTAARNAAWPESHALYLAHEHQQGQPVHGALMFAREDGACLLYLPGWGVEGFASLQQLRADLVTRLNDQALRGPLLRNMSQAYQDLGWQLAADPDLSAEPYTDDHLILAPFVAPPFEHAIAQQLDKQHQDVAYACNDTRLRQHDLASWQLGIQTALAMPGLLGPAAMLHRRESELQQRRQALEVPEWLRHASADERQRYLDSLLSYEQVRLTLGSLMQGCSSARAFARLRLTERLHNDLGYPLDPDQVIVTTRRRSLLGQAPFETRRTLSEVGLYGLHSHDLDPSSDWLTGTHFSLDGQSLSATCPLLTAQWLGATVTELDLRIQFSERQRQVYGTASVKDMIGEVLRRQLLVHAYSALYQGHIQPGDFAFTDRLLGHPEAPRVSVRQVRLNNRQLMSDMLLLTLEKPDGSPGRLLLWTPNNPGGQALYSFNNERQVRQELVAWTAVVQQSQYLLDQVTPPQRPDLARQLLALRDKPLAPENFLGFVEHPGFNDGLHAMATAHVQLKLAEHRQHTPDWYVRASASQRCELLALEDAVEGVSRQYQAQRHTRTPEYEAFVHQYASDRINALLGVPDGTVDPDRIIVTSPRETLSYTRMLRDGYDDSLGLLTATADTQATFSGPAGVDLSPLTPEKVAASVRGAWSSDAWIAHLRQTQLDPQSEGYAYRRRVSLLITQLQMRAAALRSHLKRQLSESQYLWLKQSINQMHNSDAASRQRYPVYPLQFVIDNPFIASDVPALGDALKTLDPLLPIDIPLARRETAQGCYILCPPGKTAPDQALLYTPNAPDGLEWRVHGQFMHSLHAPGMSDYYKDRCRQVMNRTLAFWFIDLKKTNNSPPPALADKPFADLQAVCFNHILERRIRDVQDTVSGRSDLIARITWNTLELMALTVTLPFPPASFAVGAVLTLRDSAQALQALSEGDREAASLHVLSAWLNAFGAAGDASTGLKGFGGLLQQLTDQGGHNPLLASVKQAQVSTVSRLHAGTHAPLRRAVGHDPYALLASGHFTQQEIAAFLRPRTPEAPRPVIRTTPQPNPAYVTRQSLDGTEPVSNGHAKGVTRLDGHYYISLEGNVYEVQFDAHRRLWQIIDPANPYAFYGKQPVYLTDSGQWRLLDSRGLRGGGGTRFEPLENEPATAGPSSAPLPSSSSAYELSEQWMQQLPGIVNRNWTLSVDVGMALPPEFFAPLLREGREVYARLREALRKDAAAFFEQPALAAKADLPELHEAMTADDLIKAAFSRSQGLVISETPASQASKQLLIEHMPRLAEQNVSVLYLEHLFTDQHLAKLRKYYALGKKSRTGSAELREHLSTLNKGALFNGSDSHDYYHLIKAAHRHGIEVRPFSSSVSYDFIDSTAPMDPTDLQRMSVFFGSRLIAADTAQVPGRRWVALLDHKHANLHHQVPGIAELHGALSIRVQDVASGQPLRIVRDLPGTGIDDSVSRGDFRLDMANPDIKPAIPVATPDIEAARPQALDLALAQLFKRQALRAQPESPSALLSQQLLENPGAHGFRLDDNGQWQRVAAADWPANLEPTALQRSLADPLYEVPTSYLDAAHELALFEHRGLHPLYGPHKKHQEPARRVFFRLRNRLQADARTLTQQPLRPRPTLPDVSGLNSQADLIDSLYAQTPALIIGEYHSSIASKQFIIDNLPHLSRRQVKTLYLEHLQADMHQLDLDLFAEKGLMSKRLLHYLKQMDRGFYTDPNGIYTFEQLVIKAREHGIEVRALDCMPSYYLRNMQVSHHHDRLFMMNFFASRTIRRHQELAGPHNWIALVGETHASTFEAAVPGLAELEQGISLRVYDMPPGEHFGPAGDPGRMAGDELGKQRAFIRNDYALGLPTPHGPVDLADDLLTAAQAAPVERKLYRPGLFMIEGRDTAQPVIVHRSRQNLIERTPVLRNAEGRWYIDRQHWQRLHLRPFEDLPALVQALRDLQLVQVS